MGVLPKPELPGEGKAVALSMELGGERSDIALPHELSSHNSSTALHQCRPEELLSTEVFEAGAGTKKSEEALSNARANIHPTTSEVPSFPASGRPSEVLSKHDNNDLVEEADVIVREMGFNRHAQEGIDVSSNSAWSNPGRCQGEERRRISRAAEERRDLNQGSERYWPRTRLDQVLISRISWATVLGKIL